MAHDLKGDGSGCDNETVIIILLDPLLCLTQKTPLIDSDAPPLIDSDAPPLSDSDAPPKEIDDGLR